MVIFVDVPVLSNTNRVMPARTSECIPPTTGRSFASASTQRFGLPGGDSVWIAGRGQRSRGLRSGLASGRALRQGSRVLPLTTRPVAGAAGDPADQAVGQALPQACRRALRQHSDPAVEA